MNSREGRGEFRKFSFEPYERHVIVEGYRKEAHSVMFPEEYDPLAVLRVIKNARDQRDRTLDKPSRDDNKIIADVNAPLLDGKTAMKMRLILEKGTDKIMTAMPRAKKQQLMKGLSEPDVQNHLGIK